MNNDTVFVSKYREIFTTEEFLKRQGKNQFLEKIKKKRDKKPDRIKVYSYPIKQIKLDEDKQKEERYKKEQEKLRKRDGESALKGKSIRRGHGMFNP